MLKTYIDSDKLLMQPDWIYRHAIYQGSLVSQYGLINLNKKKIKLQIKDYHSIKGHTLGLQNLQRLKSYKLGHFIVSEKLNVSLKNLYFAPEFVGFQTMINSGLLWQSMVWVLTFLFRLIQPYCGLGIVNLVFVGMEMASLFMPGGTILNLVRIPKFFPFFISCSDDFKMLNYFRYIHSIHMKGIKYYSPTVTHGKTFVYDFCVL